MGDIIPFPFSTAGEKGDQVPIPEVIAAAENPANMSVEQIAVEATGLLHETSNWREYVLREAA